MKPTKQYAEKVLKLLETHFPNAKMILEWGNNFELLVSIILSAQCTDVMVNKVTSTVFPKYKHLRAELREKYVKYERAVKLPKEELVEIVNFAFVPIGELEQDIRSTGFYKNKAKSVQAAARMMLEKYKGVLPKTIEEMITIPGVGRKTANVFLGNAYGIIEGIAVDTHIRKQAQELGLTQSSDPDKIEQDLMKLFDKKDWFRLTYMLIELGRNKRKKKSDRYVCKDGEKCLLCASKSL